MSGETLTPYTGVFYTGGSLNPARSLGPAIVNTSFPGYFWIYFLGPILGALLACAFYALLKNLRYHECNPGQDDDGYKAPHSPYSDVEQAKPGPASTP